MKYLKNKKIIFLSVVIIVSAIITPLTGFLGLLLIAICIDKISDEIRVMKMMDVANASDEVDNVESPKDKEKKAISTKRKTWAGIVLLCIVFVLLLIKIIFMPRTADFIAIPFLVILLIQIVIEMKSDKYLDKDEYLVKKAEYVLEKKQNRSAKFRYNRKTASVSALALILVYMVLYAIYGGSCSYEWAYKYDIKGLKSGSSNRYNHFPEDIPDGAENVEWDHVKLLRGSHTHLRFEASDEYIDKLVKSFNNEKQLYTYKSVEDKLTENATVLGYYNSEGNGKDLENMELSRGFEKAFDKDEVKVVYPENEGEAMIYVAEVEEEAYSYMFDNGIFVNTKTNTVVYFACHRS